MGWTSFISKSVSTGQLLPSQFSYLVWSLSELVFSISDLEDNLDAERVDLLELLDHFHTRRSPDDKNGHYFKIKRKLILPVGTSWLLYKYPKILLLSTSMFEFSFWTKIWRLYLITAFSLLLPSIRIFLGTPQGKRVFYSIIGIIITFLKNSKFSKLRYPAWIFTTDPLWSWRSATNNMSLIKLGTLARLGMY